MKLIQNYTKEVDIEKIGVYAIIHSDSPNKIYIGSTKAKKGFNGRWYNHIFLLKKNKHYSKHLQNIVNKYGLNGLTFKILEKVYDTEFLYTIEQKWLDYYNAEINYTLLNYAPIVAANTLSITKETKAKISKSLKGKYTRNLSGNAKKLFLYSKSGDFIKEYSCILEACEEFNSKNSNFRVIDKPLYHKGFLFTRKLLTKEEIVYFKMFSSCKKYWCRLPVAQYDLKGNLIKIWASLEDASKYYNITTGGLNQAVKGKVKISKNSIWKYFKYQNPWDLKKN